MNLNNLKDYLVGELVEMAVCEDNKDEIAITVIVSKSEFESLNTNLLYKTVTIKKESDNEQSN